VSAAVRFGVLGPTSVDAGSTPVLIGPPQRRAILALLIVEAGRTLSTDAVVESLWGAGAPATAAKNVHVHVSQLRKLLGDRLPARAGGYRLDLALDDTVDLDDFATAISRARAALSTGDRRSALVAYTAALRCWRGDALADLVDRAPGHPQAQALDAQRAEAVREWVDLTLVVRDPDAEPMLRDLATRFPLDEQISGALMVTLHRAGRPGEALAVYRATAGALDAALGTVPGRALQATSRAVRQGTLVPARPGPHRARATGTRHRNEATVPVPVRQLPPDLPDLVARAAQEEIAAAARRVGDIAGTVRITGAAGTGKTVVAVHAGHALAGRYPHGQLYADLRGATSPRPPLEVLTGFLRALGVPEDRIPDRRDEAGALYRSRIAEARLLVLLDDAADEDQVRPLLPTGPGSLALVTSRSTLAGLAGAEAVPLTPFTPEEAERLLRRIIGDRRVDEERHEVVSLLRRCGHLPLAIRIAGARLSARPHWRIRDLFGVDASDHDLLDRLRAGDLHLRRVLAGAWDAVGPADRRLLRQLAAHVGLQFCDHAAASLAGKPLAVTRESLDRLADAHLIQPMARRGAHRMHELTLVYANEAGISSTNADATLHAHLRTCPVCGRPERNDD